MRAAAPNEVQESDVAARGPPGPPGGARERFHVLAGDTCNNNCLFCMEHEPVEGLSRGHGVTAERVRRLLESRAGEGEVMFTSGEPTLNPRLPEYLRWARELGYHRVGLTTNGRRLGYAAYARRLLDWGLNHVVVSIHGPDARSHDGQTRTPGSFAQTLAGLEALARLRGEYQFTLHTSTVVGRRNLLRLGELHGLLAHFGVDQCVFNVMQPLGRAAPLVRSLVARYGDVVREFARLMRAPGGLAPPAFLVDLPPCTTESLPQAVRGWVEYAVFTEFGADEGPRERQTRVHKEEENRLKRAECEKCRHAATCLGVWRNYVQAFGWNEFQPVPAHR